MQRPDDKAELVTTLLGIAFGAGVGVVVARAITDGPLTWALIIGAALGVVVIVIARRQDRKERW
jgi:predicted MFS family arabinose efflux permease